jgi:Holliday junction resolvase
MPKRSRDKGARTERAIVRALQERGFAAEKVSGMYKPGADLSVPLLGADRRVEVKCRGKGFRQLYDWLDGAEFLIVKSDRRELLVVVPFRLAIEIAKAAENSRQQWGSCRTNPVTEE